MYEFTIHKNLSECTNSLLCTDIGGAIATLKGKHMLVELCVCGEVAIFDRKTEKEYHNVSEYPVSLIQDIKFHRVYYDKRWDVNEVNSFEFCICRITEDGHTDFFDFEDYGLNDLSKYSSDQIESMMREILSNYEYEIEI